MQGIANSAGRLIAAGVNIAVKIMQGIANSAGRLIAAGTNIVVKIINGISNSLSRIIAAGTNLIVKFIQGVSNGLGKIIAAGTNLIVRFADGLAKGLPRIAQSVTTLIVIFLMELGKNMPRIVDAGFKLIIDFINSVTSAINNNSAQMGAAGADLAWAIVKGMIDGLQAGAGQVIEKAKSIVGGAIDAAWEKIKPGSPSKVFRYLGEMSSLGLAVGLTDYANVVEKSAANVGQGAINSLKTTMSGMSQIVSGDIDIRPVIAPVLDLSQVKKDATQIGTMIGGQSIKAGVSYDKASSISSDRQAAMAAALEVAARATEASAPAPITFEQNNYSPKTLTPVEIYRNTKNQLSLAKEALQ